jgi:hypothetical protein
MAPLPACHGAAMPLCSPSGSKLKGEYSPTAALPSARAGQSDRSANGSMAPMPALFGATTPSLRRSHNFGPAQSAAVTAGKLKVMECTSLKIAVAISEGRHVTNGWAVAHLARHLDLLELGWQSVLDALAEYFGQVMNRPGYSTSCLGRSTHADYFGSVRAIGAAIDKATGQRGHTVTLLLRWLLPPAAQGLLAPYPTPPWAERMPSPSSAGSPSPARQAPFHPQRSMGGSREGLMAPSPANHGATKPSTSLALPSAPACSMMTPTGSSSAPSPPTTTGGGATAAEHRAATTHFCWVRHTWLRRWFTQQRRKRLHTLCRGASAYAASVWGNRRPPPISTDMKSSDPKALSHPFRKRGLPIPQPKKVQQHNRPRCRPG